MFYAMLLNVPYMARTSYELVVEFQKTFRENGFSLTVLGVIMAFGLTLNCVVHQTVLDIEHIWDCNRENRAEEVYLVKWWRAHGGAEEWNAPQKELSSRIARWCPTKEG